MDCYLILFQEIEIILSCEILTESSPNIPCQNWKVALNLNIQFHYEQRIAISYTSTHFFNIATKWFDCM